MNKIDVINEVMALRKIREDFEELLKPIDINLDNLPADCLTKLNEYANFKTETKLVDAESSYIEAYFYEKELEHLDNIEVITKLNNEIQELEEDINKDKADIIIIQKVADEFVKSAVTLAEKAKIEDEFQMQQKSFKNRLIQMSASQQINMDDLIAKVENIKKAKS